MAVRVHILAEKRDLFDTAFGQVTDFGQNLAHGAADFRATPQAHDAIGTQVVATLADRYAGGDRGIGIGQTKVGDRRLIAGRLLSRQIDERWDVGGLDKGVDPGVALCQFRDLVYKATHHRQAELWPAAFQAQQ